VRAIKQASARHLVLLFRGQTLSQDDQLRFASYFGTLGDRKRAPEAARDRAHQRTASFWPSPRSSTSRWSRVHRRWWRSSKPP